MAIVETEPNYEAGATERFPFEREPSQLIALGCYEPYLIDDPRIVPVRPYVKDTSETRYVHQHLWFKEPDYLQLCVPSQERDERLARLRNSLYSQIIMRNFLEKLMHKEKEETVAPPPPETRDSTLMDYFDLDIVGGATVAIQELQTPRELTQWEEKYYEPPTEIQALSKADKIKMLTEARRKAFSSLENPRVLPDYFVTSALMRMAIHLRDFTLHRVAAEKLNGDDFFYPLGVPRRGTFRSVGGMILMDGVGLRPLGDSRLVAQALQTGVDRELKAA